MTNLFGSFDIGILDFLGTWCLVIEISENPNTRDRISNDYPSNRYKNFNPEPGTFEH
jgi:hypothetical protein